MQKVDIKITMLFSFVETRNKNLSALKVVSSALITQIWSGDKLYFSDSDDHLMVRLIFPLGSQAVAVTNVQMARFDFNWS